MSENKEGIIVILSSPSGAGKTTLVKEISKKRKFEISISHTTRKPRVNEFEGRDYFFIGEEKFKKLIEENKFLEYAKVFKNFYGSSKENVFKNLDKGINVLFDIDWQGTQKIRNQNLKYKIISIFILPPTRNELYKRLLNRDRNDENIANERMKQFDEDIKHWKEYDFVVVNDKIENCCNKIIKFIDENKNIKYESSEYQKLIENHVKNLLN